MTPSRRFSRAALTPETAGLALNVGGDDAVHAARAGRGADRGRMAAGVSSGASSREERKRIDIGDFVTDDRRFRALTGWAPRLGLDEGLARSLDYYRRHLARYL